MSNYTELLCRVRETVTPYPDCSDLSTLTTFDASSVSNAMFLCQWYKSRLIVIKVYFSIAVVNVVYVLITSTLLIYRTKAVNHEKRLIFSMNESQMNSLRKRNVLALAVGATGHLMIASIFIVVQAMNGCLYCPVFMYISTYGYFLWIASFIWRAYYLRFQLKLNKTKLRLGNGETKEDREWYMHNKNQHSISNRRFLCLICLGLLLITGPLVLTHRFYYGFQEPQDEDCATRLGTVILICLVTFFSCFVAPFLIWWLRHDRDAHNLRNELIAIFAIGIPTSVLYIVWITAIPSAFHPEASHVRLYWGSINWILINQIAAHFISITYPLLVSYGLCSCRCIKQERMKSRSSSVNLHFELDCSLVSLEYILSQPELLEHMKNVAVQDFSAENVLFCEHYRILADKVTSELTEKKMTYTEIKKGKLKGLPDTSIPCDMLCDYIAFYNTFIKEGAPLQVNIAHSDRKSMDKVFSEIASQHGHILEHAVSQIKPNAPDAWSTANFTPANEQATTKDESNSISEEQLLNQETGTIIPCSIFDTARKEVMWIILCNILPKFLDNCK